MSDGSTLGGGIAEKIGDIAAKAGDAVLDEVKKTVTAATGQISSAPTASPNDPATQQRSQQDKQESDTKMKNLRLELHQQAQQLGVTHTPTIEEIREQEKQQEEAQKAQGVVQAEGLGVPTLPGAPPTDDDNLTNLQVKQAQNKMESGRNAKG